MPAAPGAGPRAPSCAKRGIRESKLERGARRYCRDGELKIAVRRHVDDPLIARRTDSPNVDELLAQMFLRLDRRERKFEHCGANVAVGDDGVRISRANVAMAVERAPRSVER